MNGPACERRNIGRQVSRRFFIKSTAAGLMGLFGFLSVVPRSATCAELDQSIHLDNELTRISAEYLMSEEPLIPRLFPVVRPNSRML